MSIGTVYLVGAGPGDPELITLKAKRFLEEADVVVYDYLANEQLLSYVKPDAECIYVGKKAGQHTMKQEDINALLVDLARKHASVVRLKGGDPFVFGRGGEEALELAANQIPFEIVPGIPAAIGATAYAGIPVTHRAIATSVAFITGHEAEKSDDSASVNWTVMDRLNKNPNSKPSSNRMRRMRPGFLNSAGSSSSRSSQPSRLKAASTQVFTMLITKAARIAHQNRAISRPVSHAVTNNNSPSITKMNRPALIMVSGRVSASNTGRT